MIYHIFHIFSLNYGFYQLADDGEIVKCRNEFVSVLHKFDVHFFAAVRARRAKTCNIIDDNLSDFSLAFEASKFFD
jgi:hypothetical protein